MKMKRAKQKNAVARKQQILTWAEKNGRLPRRKSTKVLEKRVGQRLENLLSPTHPSFDAEFRNLIYSKFPRKVNNKRAHNKALRVSELLTFMRTYNRAPSGTIREERKLHSTLSNYCGKGSSLYNAKAEKKVLAIDKCYRTMVPKKYRQCVNVALAVTNSKLKEEF
jgi:hypothetical protein